MRMREEMWCAVPELKLRKENQWLFVTCAQTLPSMLSEYSSSVPKFWSLENCRSACVERELYIFLPARNPCCMVVAMTFVFLCGGIIYWMCPRWITLLLLHLFVCLIFVFPLCCGGRCIWAWRAFRCVPFRCTSLLFLCFVVVFFKCCSVISWPTSLGGCWISSVSKCCSVVPLRLVPPSVSQCGQNWWLLWSWFGSIRFILKLRDSF